MIPEVVPCTDTGKVDGKVIQNSVDPVCMGQIAKGKRWLTKYGDIQGHRAAEAFSMCAMGKLAPDYLEESAVHLAHFVIW